MARDSLNEADRHCLESVKTIIEASHEICENTKQELKSQRVRFADDDNITERFVSTDEVDAAPRVKKVHILKHRSSSETSILLRTPSLNRQHPRSASVDVAQLQTKDNLNNNTLNENLNGKTPSILKPVRLVSGRLTEKLENGSTKENELNNFKKNYNIYSVNQAKLIHSERKKSLPLSSIPKLIGHRASDSGQRSLTTEVVGDDNVDYNKDFTTRAIGKISRGIGKLLRRSNSVKISEPDPVYKVAYLGNVLTGWARGENCVEKPLATLWRNYNQSTKPDVVMKLSITNSGLKGVTKDHGLTEYWSHRITYCASPPHYPKIFCWVYRHEGRKLKHELRCHAVLCSKESVAKKITEDLQLKLKQALAEFKKDKICKQNARLSLANSVYDNPTMPRRKILLSIGAANYRPPLERSKSAPKLGAIEEMYSEEEEEADTKNEGSDKCESIAKSAVSSGSYRWLTEKIKSPRKHSFPEQLSRTMYRCADAENTEESSFTDEVLDLISKNFKTDNNECKGTFESSRSNTHVEHSKMARFTLGSIDETNEMRVSESHCLGRDCKVLEMLGQTSFVTDSDDGSVSSGCETASTANSSDTELSSLPHSQDDFCPEKFDEAARQAPLMSKCDRSYQRRSTSSVSDCRKSEAENDLCSEIASHSITDLSTDEESEREPSEEVNIVPIGEKNSFKRRSTYPPLKDIQDMFNDYANQFDSMIDNMAEYDQLVTSNDDNEVFKNSGDNVSACSDESGYSELVEPGKESSIASTIMV